MKNILLLMAIIVIAIVIIAGGIVVWIYPHHAQPAKAAQTKTMEPTIPPAPARIAEPAQPSAAQMQLAIVHKGEGVESAFIRQFAASPAAYGFNGKQNDAKAIHQWAGHQAALLAIKAGYYDWKFGAEVRVAVPDKTAYVIQKDAAGNLTVVEYAITTAAGSSVSTNSTTGTTFSQGTTHVSSTTVGASNFFGASPITGNKLPVPHWEYVYFPGE